MEYADAPERCRRELLLRGCCTHCREDDLIGNGLDPSQKPRISTIAVLASLTMVGFAANSLLARLALTTTSIDPTSFTLIRLVSGAAVLILIACVRGRGWSLRRPNVRHGTLLLTYALAFSYAYRGISAAKGC